jgi:hypothetical protein
LPPLIALAPAELLPPLPVRPPEDAELPPELEPALLAPPAALFDPPELEPPFAAPPLPDKTPPEPLLAPALLEPPLAGAELPPFALAPPLAVPLPPAPELFDEPLSDDPHATLSASAAGSASPMAMRLFAKDLAVRAAENAKTSMGIQP